MLGVYEICKKILKKVRKKCSIKKRSIKVREPSNSSIINNSNSNKAAEVVVLIIVVVVIVIIIYAFPDGY